MKKRFLVTLVFIFTLFFNFSFPLPVYSMSEEENKVPSCDPEESALFEKQFSKTIEDLILYISSNPSRGDGDISVEDLDYWEDKSRELYLDYLELEPEADILCPEALAMWQAGNEYVETGFVFCASLFGDPTMIMPFSDDQMRDFKKVQDKWMESQKDFAKAAT